MKIIKFFFKSIIIFFIYILLVRFINPPITFFQIDGMFFASQTSEFSFKRDYINWDEMGENIKLAAICAEDQNFLNHDGFDWNSIKTSLEKDKKGSAASTISQQTVKNAFLWQGSGIFKYIRKVFEFPVTYIVEKFYTKQRILELYLNIIETGPGIYGVEAASQYYFNKSSKDLTKSEAAKIVACLPNPKKFIANEKNIKTKKRYKWVIKQMNNLETEKKIKKLLQ